jgi:hypothetical protein
VPVCNLVLLMCAIYGVAFTLGGGKRWWMEQFYEAEGVRTESGLIIGKRTVDGEGAEGGTITEHLVRYRFHDQFGRAQEFEVTAERLRRQSSESVVGTCLPMIEYLASDPKVHRFASEKGSGKKLFWFGVGLLVAIIPIRLIDGVAMRLFGHERRLMI